VKCNVHEKELETNGRISPSVRIFVFVLLRAGRHLGTTLPPQKHNLENNRSFICFCCAAFTCVRAIMYVLSLCVFLVVRVFTEMEL
jgi:hypothetical protein